MKTWLPVDDAKLVSLIETYGYKWKQFTKQFPGRSVSSIRNRWLRILAGKDAAANNNNKMPRCAYCKKPKRGHICWALLHDTTAAMASENPEKPDDEDEEEGDGEYSALALSVKSMQIPPSTTSILADIGLGNDTASTVAPSTSTEADEEEDVTFYAGPIQIPVESSTTGIIDDLGLAFDPDSLVM